MSKTIKLGEACSVLSGYAFKSKQFGETGMPIIRIRDVVRGYSETFFDGSYDKKYEINNDDVLIGMDGDFNTSKWLGGKALLNQRVCKIEVDQTKLNKSFIYYFLPIKLKEIWNDTPFVTVKHLSVKKILDIDVPDIPLKIQKHIASVLEKADQLRKDCQLLEQELNQLAQSVFIEMFGDPVTNPKGWERANIGKLCDVKTGSTPKRVEDDYYGGDIPWVKTGEVVGEYIYSSDEKITSKAISETNCKIFPEFTILVAMYGQGKTRGRVGMLMKPSATNQACAAICPSLEINQTFLFYYLKTQYTELRRLGRGGNQENLNLSMVKSYEIIVPPSSLQIAYVMRVSKLRKIISENKNSENYYINLFNALSQKAFKGELKAAV